MSEVAISVVIATCNRAALLGECLTSLVKQTLSPHSFEIIVINDGSKDGTADFLEALTRESVLPLRVLSHKNRGVSYSRNCGIDAARADIIAFTDDDCLVPPDWLEHMLCFWDGAADHVAGVGGPLTTVTAGAPSFVSHFLRYVDEFNYIPVLTDWLIRPVHVSQLTGEETVPYLRTANASFRKSCLQAVGGFDTAFRSPGGEDPDLCYRIMNHGFRFHLDKRLVVDHQSRGSLGGYFRTLRNYVVGEARKSRKRAQYPQVVARTYRLIPLKKVASLLLSVSTLPFAWRQALSLKEMPLVHRLAFPPLVVASKVYALAVSLRETLAGDE